MATNGHGRNSHVIGKIEPKYEIDDAGGEKKKNGPNATRDLEVMGFPMHIKNSQVIVDGKPKPVKEGPLKGKFEEEETYSKVDQAMTDAFAAWEDEKEGLDKKAFHMYEQFRPNVASGSLGWGRKGELNLRQIKSTIEP